MKNGAKYYILIADMDRKNDRMSYGVIKYVGWFNRQTKYIIK